MSTSVIEMFIIPIYIISYLNIPVFSHFILQKVQAELEGIKKDLDKTVEKSEAVLATSQQSSSAPVLRSEIDITQKKMEHVYSLSAVYLEK